MVNKAALEGNFVAGQEKPNASAHRERPDRDFSDFAKVQRGSDAVARVVSQLHRGQLDFFSASASSRKNLTALLK